MTDPGICQHCQSSLDDVQEAGGFLVCVNCGHVVETLDLVYQSYDDAGPTGVLIRSSDDGRAAGTVASACMVLSGCIAQICKAHVQFFCRF